MLISGETLQAPSTPHLGTSAESGAEISRQVHELFHGDSSVLDNLPEKTGMDVPGWVNGYHGGPAVRMLKHHVAALLPNRSESQRLQCLQNPSGRKGPDSRHPYTSTVSKATNLTTGTSVPLVSR